MKSKSKTPTKKNKGSASRTAAIKDVNKQTYQDIKHAALITSGLANMFVLIGWALLQTTTEYHDQVAWLLFR